MCANYTPTRLERLRAHFACSPVAPYPDETWPGYAAPFIRRARGDVGYSREACTGLFGLVPYWSKDLTIGRRTYNARSETAAEKPSFRDPWRFGRKCIVAAEAIFEPSWETGKAVRWRISRADGAPMGIAGLWGSWRSPDDAQVLSFTMLTVNATGHEVMKRFHKPQEEKRMIVVLDEADYDAWLEAPLASTADFMKLYPPAALKAEPAPL